MKTAVCVTAYKAPRVLAAAARAYTAMGWSIYAHLDAKIASEEYGDIPGVHFIPNRVTIWWAGMAQVEAQFRLFEAAIADGADMIVYVSDDTMPIRSLDDIIASVENCGDQLHMQSVGENDPFVERYEGFCCRDHAATNPRGGWPRLFDANFFDLIAECDGLRRIGKKRLSIWWGYSYRVLTADTVNRVMFIARSDAHLWASFKFSAIPEETLIPMVIANYIRPGSRQRGPMFMDFTKGHGPLIYTEIPVEIPAQCLFARKFAADADCEAIVDRLIKGNAPL